MELLIIMIVLDIETAGMEPEKHSLLSIGAVEFENPDNTFYGECRADDGTIVSPMALQINGFRMDDLWDRKKPTSEELIKKFLEWTETVKDRKLGGDNIWFDISFMKHYLRKLGIGWPFPKKSVELHELHPIADDPQWSLDIVLELVGMPMRRGPHNGLEDALLETEVMSRLMTGKGTIKRFEKHKVPKGFPIGKKS